MARKTTILMNWIHYPEKLKKAIHITDEVIKYIKELWKVIQKV
jgi:hypothetical protein